MFRALQRVPLPLDDGVPYQRQMTPPMMMMMMMMMVMMMMYCRYYQ